MPKLCLLILLVWNSGAVGGNVDDFFATGAFGVPWGAPLETVQKVFPQGVSYPIAMSRYDHDITPVMYAVQTQVPVLGINMPCASVGFLFDKSGHFKKLACYFQYLDRDTALYEIAEVLGQDYATRDDGDGRVYWWKPGKSASAAMYIGRLSPFEWVYFGVRAHSQETPSDRKK